MYVQLSRYGRVGLYVFVLAIGFALGSLLARGVEALIAGYPGFAATCILALSASAAALCLAEARYLWGATFQSSDQELRWISNKRTRLTSTPPAPFSLGMALGLLLRILL